MSKLKTLNDLELYQCLEDYPRCDLEMNKLSVYIRDLKQEAINWINHWCDELGCKILYKDFVNKQVKLVLSNVQVETADDLEKAKEIMIKCNTFVDFFNITEEDLKSEDE